MNSDSRRCPVPGCNFAYRLGTVGWHRHVKSCSVHPFWLVDVTDPVARVSAFRTQFPDFLPKKEVPHTEHLESIKDRIEELRRALDTTALMLKSSRARLEKTG
jgi:hypothetical protein